LKLKQSNPTSYTPDYGYGSASPKREKHRGLHCEGVAVERIARSAGTPTYVYSRHSIEHAYRKLANAFGSLPHMVCYAVKANSNLSILRIFARLGAGFDVVSGGELDRLRRIGVRGNRIVFSGVGKSRDEIREALRYSADGKRGRSHGILTFNVESSGELEVLLSEASRRGPTKTTRVCAAIRINPDVMAGGHRHISTGYRHHKFGLGWEEARRLYVAHKDSPWIKWSGISAHIGSQIVTLTPFQHALSRIASHVGELGRAGIVLDHVDIGGGLGIRYTDEDPVSVNAYAAALSRIMRPLGCKLMLEPGRWLVGPAGVLLTRVLYVKQGGTKKFVVVDAGMNDLIRPALYDATHPITKAVQSGADRSGRERVDVVGPVCETGDFLARDWPLERVEPGDLLVVWAAGAYGFAEASNYNSRPRAAEVMVEGSRFRVIRRRESRDDMVRNEI
jgi:diaminopimelate decarboxylase